MSHSGRYRNWVFTWNNPEADDYQTILNLKTRYCIFQKEVGESGTPHYQGTLCFGELLRFKSMKKLLPKCHFEPCADLEASINYCKKPEGRVDGPWETGCKPSQGARNDIKKVADMAKAGKSIKEIATEEPVIFIKFHKGIEKLREVFALERNWAMEVNVYTGTTGTGKTKMAFEKCKNPYMKPQGDWWDGYDGHEDVIIDDFTCDMPIAFLLKVLDRYPMHVPIKGGFRSLVAKRIFLTSNIPLEEWYTGARQEHRDALRRRITDYKKFSDPFQLIPLGRKV